jgi:hypothetical protein
MADLGAARTSLTSRTACLEAELRYSVLFHRYDPADPEAGFEQAYDAGRRWLLARSNAVDWALPDQIAGRVDALFRHVDQLPDDEVDEWLDQFPRVFTELLDRRRAPAEIVRPGRRGTDRISRSETRSKPLVGSGAR